METWEKLLSRVPMVDRWRGSIAIDGESPFVTDGHLMFRRVYADSRRLERLLQVPIQERVIPADRIQQYWDAILKSAAHPLKVLQVFDVGERDPEEKRYYIGFDVAGQTAVFDAELVRCSALLLGFDQLKGCDPLDPVVAYRKGVPVAVIAPTDPSPRVLAGVRAGVEEPA